MFERNITNYTITYTRTVKYSDGRQEVKEIKETKRTNEDAKLDAEATETLEKGATALFRTFDKLMKKLFKDL